MTDIEQLKAAVAGTQVRPSPRLDFRIDPPAKTFYSKLHKQIQDFEKTLQPGESITLIHASALGPCQVHSIGFHGADLIVLSGLTQDNQACRLLVHMHAVNLSVVVAKGEKSRRAIGFSGELGKEPEGSAPAPEISE
jgi:hypothetical protein